MPFQSPIKLQLHQCATPIQLNRITTADQQKLSQQIILLNAPAVKIIIDTLHALAQPAPPEYQTL